MVVPQFEPRASAFLRTVAWIVAVCGGAGVVTFVGAIVVLLVRRRPVNGFAVLALPAVPLGLVIGAWMGFTIYSRAALPGEARSRVFNPADWVVLILGGLAAAGFLIILSGVPATTQGDPDGATAQCPYNLNTHGVYTCVSKARYERVERAGQRMGAGVGLLAFSVETGFALGIGFERPRRPAEPT